MIYILISVQGSRWLDLFRDYEYVHIGRLASHIYENSSGSHLYIHHSTALFHIMAPPLTKDYWDTVLRNSDVAEAQNFRQGGNKDLLRHRMAPFTGTCSVPCTYQLCTFSYKSTSARNKHIRRDHLNIRYSCTFPGCMKTFSEQHKVREHISKVHEGNRNLQCPFCPHRTAYGTNLTKHIKRKHTN